MSYFLTHLLSNPSSSDPNARKAYLVWLMFDKKFKFLSDYSGAQQAINPDQLGNLSVTNMKVPEEGYLYIYVSNESSRDVNFDNLQIHLNSSYLIEEDHYYPFGLLIDDISRSSSGTAQNYKYNGKELQHELSWNVEDYGARQYNPVIGRWLQVDPKADKYAGLSIYNFVADNPLNNIDQDGREIKPLTSGDISTLRSTFNQYSSLFSYTTFPTQINVGNATGQNGSYNVFTTRTPQNIFQRKLNASNLTTQQRQEATAIFNVLSSTDVVEIGVVTSTSNTATALSAPTTTNNVEIRGTTNPNAIALFNTPNKTDQTIQSSILAQPVSGSTSGGATYGYYPQPQGQATPAPRGNGGTFVGAVLINNAQQPSFTTGQANTLSPTQAVTETIQNISNLGIVR